jgi:hypothetical protein
VDASNQKTANDPVNLDSETQEEISLYRIAHTIYRQHQCLINPAEKALLALLLADERLQKEALALAAHILMKHAQHGVRSLKVPLSVIDVGAGPQNAMSNEGPAHHSPDTAARSTPIPTQKEPGKNRAAAGLREKVVQIQIMLDRFTLPTGTILGDAHIEDLQRAERTSKSSAESFSKNASFYAAIYRKLKAGERVRDRWSEDQLQELKRKFDI